jgi:hypothetical protein
MLRVPQHERKNINDFNAPPFVLSLVAGLRKGFAATSHSKDSTAQGTPVEK